MGKVYKSLADKYFDFYARSKDHNCNTYIYGVCKNKPKSYEDGATILIKTDNTKSLKHTKKRQLFRDERNKAKEVLRFVPATTLQV